MLVRAWKWVKNDPIWSKVAASAIFALLLSLSVWVFPGGWTAGADGVYAAWKRLLAALSTPRSVPTWTFIVLGLILVVVGILALVAWMVIIGSRAARQPKPGLHEAVFEGLVWRWGITEDGQSLDPTPFCPHCDMQIHPRHLFTGMFPRGPTGYVCDNGHGQIFEFRGTHDQLVDLFVREQQRLKRAARQRN